MKPLLSCGSVLLLLLAGVPQAQAAAPEVVRLACQARLSTQTLACSPLISAPMVALPSQAARYDVLEARWSAEVVVRNLSARWMGTEDGLTPTSDGVQVVLLDAPTVVEGHGTVQARTTTVQYAAMLAPGASSAPQTWAFNVPATVEAFAFNVAVLAAITYPRSYVNLTPSSGNLLPTETLALSGVGRTAKGLPVLVPSWSSSNPAVATVNASGLVTALTPGNTVVSAANGSLSGQATVLVCPNLAVGEVYDFVMPAGSSFCLKGAAGAAAEYTLLPSNQSTSSSLSLTTTASGIVAVTGPPSPTTLRFDPGSAQASLGLGAVNAEPDLPHALREAERAELARLGPEDRIQPGPRASAALGKTSAITPGIPQGVPAVGDRWLLNVAQGCSGARDDRKGFVRAVTSRAIIVEDSLAPAGGAMPYTSASTTYSADSLGRMFSRVAYGPVAAAYGDPTDLDNNGGRVVLFYTRAVNELSPPASSVVTLGYVTARDLYSSDPSSCPRSNQGEIAYMLVPDPTGQVNSNVRTVATVQGQTIGTAGHELAHVISNSRRLYFNGNAPFQEAWLEEGTAHIAEELMFYAESVGLTPRQNIVVTNLTTGPNASRRVAAYNTYANSNYGRLKGYLNRPDTTTIFSNTSPSLSQRGAMWAFLRYAADRYANEQVAALGGAASTYESAFWAGLVKNATTAGFENLRQALGLATTSDVFNWFRDWQIAMYTDDAVTGVAARHTNPSWNYRSLYTALNGSYQLAPRALTSNVGLTLSYKRGGGNTWQRFGVPADATATYTLNSGGVIPTSPFSLSVIRTK